MPARPSPHSLLKSVHTAKAAPNLVANSRRVRRVASNGPQSVPFALPKRFITTSTPSVSAAGDVLKETKYADLEKSLRNEQWTVWKTYINLLNTSGFGGLPLEVHQEVLRKCTVSSQEARTHAVLQNIDGANLAIPHRHERRFKTVIGNIRGAGYTPSLDDYHFVLSQFAAVGNFPASMQVYDELQVVGHTPTARTFGYILQGMAHRLSLPIPRTSRDAMLTKVNVAFNGLLKDMKKFNIPTVQANIDLSFRILKESMNYQAFDRFVRWAYGVDMSFPDRVPLDLAEPEGISDTQKLPVPFSTNALNTAIDFLGRAGHLSKMVQAFEVLTQPLPLAQEHFFSSFEDDEDDIGAVLPKSEPKPKQPSAQANTTTYSLLIRHSARAGHHTLARHYLNEAIQLNQDIALGLRRTMHIDDSHITQPRFSLRKDHFRPILTLGNKSQDKMLLEWLQRKFLKQLRMKEAELHWHTTRQKFHERKAAEASCPPSPTSPHDTFAPTPSTSADHLDLDHDTSTSSLSNSDSKPFDSALHIRILERDIEEFSELQGRVDWFSGRAHQRTKEKLGRRIWEGKDVYVMHKGRRVKVSKLKWMHMMNFKPMKTGTEEREAMGAREEQQILEEREAIKHRKKQQILEEQRDGFFTTSAVGKELKELKEKGMRTSSSPKAESNESEPTSPWSSS